MDWRLKCAAMHVFATPGVGRRLHYLSQRYITNSVPRPQKLFRSSLHWARQHVEAFQRHYGGFERANYFEFGAGWDLFTNLVLYTYCMNEQFVIDVQPYAQANLVNHAIRQLRSTTLLNANSVSMPELSGDFRSALKKQYRITYAAPCDARQLAMPSGCIDLISTTSTLEHIPEMDLVKIINECFRICHKSSVLSMIIDYSDHYSQSDSTLTPYNFLKFDAESWRFFNPKLHYQNRLRHSDYRKIFEAAGFEVLEDHSSTPAQATEYLGKMSVASSFRSYDIDDLQKLVGHFVLRKRVN